MDFKTLRDRAIIREILKQQARVEAERTIIRNEKFIRTIEKESALENLTLEPSNKNVIESKTFVKESFKNLEKTPETNKNSTQEAYSQTDINTSPMDYTERDCITEIELIESSCEEISNANNKNFESEKGKLPENLNSRMVSFSETDSMQGKNKNVFKRRESINDVINFLKKNNIPSDDIQNVIYVPSYNSSDDEF